MKFYKFLFFNYDFVSTIFGDSGFSPDGNVSNLTSFLLWTGDMVLAYLYLSSSCVCLFEMNRFLISGIDTIPSFVIITCPELSWFIRACEPQFSLLLFVVLNCLAYEALGVIGKANSESEKSFENVVFARF